MTKTFKSKIVSANDLLGGDVVYLDKDLNWTREISEAAIVNELEAADALLVNADQPGKVVGPYLLDVTWRDDGVRPDHFRERFRETGPTLAAEFTRADHANQSGQKLTPEGDV
ncbi:MAG: hypothetical protein ACI9XZ_002881 [Alphaproteobacteria bacterium]|jgi:hypothetical protein